MLFPFFKRAVFKIKGAVIPIEAPPVAVACLTSVGMVYGWCSRSIWVMGGRLVSTIRRYTFRGKLLFSKMCFECFL